ncbi:hypothetical protein AX14_005130 [Amanita brunnescens Koide BX004]|nr:hypothetical protein AX14_005130 [Amanita brunnescens Koide BX004]
MLGFGLSALRCDMNEYHGITTATPGLPFLSRFGYINERGMSPALQEVNAVAEPSVFATWSATNPLAPQTLLNTMEVPSSDSSSSNGVPAPPVTAGARLEGHGISAKRWRKQIEGFKEREKLPTLRRLRRVGLRLRGFPLHHPRLSEWHRSRLL